MFYRNLTSFICIFVAAAIATVHNCSDSITGSDDEVTVYPLTTENPESSTREPDQQVTETPSVDLGALLDAGDGAVVTLVAGDTRLAAHRAVLAARSPVLAATLQRVAPGAGGGRVDVPDVEGPVLRQLVAYMYTLQAPQLPGMAPQLLAAADAYGLSSLKERCERQLAAQLSVETAAAAAVLAVKHSCASLRRASVSFIKTHIFRVMATRGWADAVKSQPDVWIKVIQLLSDPPEEPSAADPEGSGATPASQPPGDRSENSSSSSSSSSQIPTSATPPTASHSTFPSDAATPQLWSLSEEEKGRRLIEAAKEGAVEEVDALLAAGADVEATGEYGLRALDYAASEGHVEVVRRLLAAGADAGPGPDGLRITPLHYAIHGDAAVVRLLVEEASADPNARDYSGQTPLHWAAAAGRAEAAAVLLRAGSDRAATDKRGQTPLDLARKYSHQQLIDVLS